MNSAIIIQIVIALATLAASLGGYALAGANERRRDERALGRELKLRDEERGARLEDQTRALQLDTLLALQDGMQEMARLTGKALYFDHMQAREGRFTQLPGSLSDDMYSNAVQVRRLSSRVLDVSVRTAVEGFVHTCTRLSTLPASDVGQDEQVIEGRSLSVITALGDAYSEALAVLGEVTRAEIAWRPPATR